MISMEQSVIDRAPAGRSVERGLPGGWAAIVAKPIDGRRPRVWYVRDGDSYAHNPVGSYEWRYAASYLRGE